MEAGRFRPEKARRGRRVSKELKIIILGRKIGSYGKFLSGKPKESEERDSDEDKTGPRAFLNSRFIFPFSFHFRSGTQELMNNHENDRFDRF